MESLDETRLNEAFGLLAHPHRRYVLYYLTNESAVVDVETLATAITGWEGSHAGTGQSDDVEDVEVALRHSHLPKLADAGVVAFDANAGYVELGETDGVDRFLVETARVDGYTRPAADD